MVEAGSAISVRRYGALAAFARRRSGNRDGGGEAPGGRRIYTTVRRGASGRDGAGGSIRPAAFEASIGVSADGPPKTAYDLGGDGGHSTADTPSRVTDHA